MGSTSLVVEAPGIVSGKVHYDTASLGEVGQSGGVILELDISAA